MPSRKRRPGKHGTSPAQFKNKRQRAYARSIKEQCARWLWEAEKRRPEGLHGVPIEHVDGAHLLGEAGYVELENPDGHVVCRLKPAFKAWWGGGTL